MSRIVCWLIGFRSSHMAQKPKSSIIWIGLLRCGRAAALIRRQALSSGRQAAGRRERRQGTICQIDLEDPDIAGCLPRLHTGS